MKTIVVVPITSSSKLYPTRKEIHSNNRKGWVAIDQIKTIDKQRITKFPYNVITLQLYTPLSNLRL